MSRWRALRKALPRGLRKRCPRCGDGALFRSWHRLEERCPACGLEIERAAGDHWFFMYMTTAGFTGVLVLIMILFRPARLLPGQIAIVLAGIAFIVLSLPRRKGIAVAIAFALGSPEAVLEDGWKPGCGSAAGGPEVRR